MSGSTAGAILSGMGPGVLGGLGSALEQRAHKQPPAQGGPVMARPNSFKHGGVVQKTGLALVHKGEKVIPADEKEGHDEPKLSLHRALSHLNKGGLHRALGVPEGQPIPADKMQKAKNSDNPHVRKMAQFAETMEGWHHGS